MESQTNATAKSFRSRHGGSRFLSIAAFTLALLLVVFAAASAWLNVQRLRSSFDWVAHTRDVIIQVGTIDAELASAIAVQRDYLLTGEPNQLAAFHRYGADLSIQLRGLREQISDNPDQLRRLDELVTVIEKRLDFAEQAVSHGIAARPDATSATDRMGEIRTRGAIRENLRLFREAETDLLTERQAQADRDTTFSTWLAAATVALALAAAAAGVYFLRREQELLHVERERSHALELRAELLHVSRLNMVGQTASMLTHEVTQPLAAARNFLTAAQRILGADAADGVRLKDAMARSLAQIDRATDVIRHLRRFISRSNGERSPEPLAEVIAEAIALSALERSGSRILRRIDRDLPLASIDRVLIQQVLVNLMRNAVEAMAGIERGELTIRASGLDGNRIQVTVQDTGPGLPAAVAAKLFQPFVTTKEGGMGVGLSICRTIIEDHGGRIWAEPGPSGGTAFHFTLPAATMPGGTPVRPATRIDTGDRRRSPGEVAGEMAGNARV